MAAVVRRAARSTYCDFSGKVRRWPVDAISTIDFLASGTIVLIVVAVVCLARYIINL
jgi:hypothetical protein